MTDKEFVEDMRTYRLDHLPDGWPAVQTQQIDRLIAIIDRLNAMVTYDCREPGVCPEIKETAERCAALAENCPPEVTMFGSCTRCPIVPAIAGAIRKTFGLPD